jgi:antitoxin component of RelBE/YafQ-DinJ toxin-antitoxin module
MGDARERLFTMRMSDVERRRAEALAAHHGVTVAALVRMLLKKHERATGAPLPSNPPPRSR